MKLCATHLTLISSRFVEARFADPDAVPYLISNLIETSPDPNE